MAEVTRAGLLAKITEYLTTNGNNEITGAQANELMVDIKDSVAFSLQAADDPTILDDTTEGYSIGDIWTNTVTGAQFICVDATVGAAKWVNGLPIVLTGTTVGAETVELLAGGLPLTVPEDSVVFFQYQLMGTQRDPDGSGSGSASASASDITPDGNHLRIGYGIIKNVEGTTTLPQEAAIVDWTENFTTVSAAFSADDAADALTIEVDGEAGETIEWKCVMTSWEVIDQTAQ